MHKILILTIVVGLACGLVGAFAYDQLAGDAGAAPPPPQPQPVREQNLDGGGFIRVHEQGTANVVVTNTSLPVDVVSLPSQSGRLVELGTLSAPGNTDVAFATADVSNCSEMLAMARTTHSSGIMLRSEAYTSPDGSTRILSAAVDEISQGMVDGVSTTSGLIRDPHRYIAVRVLNSGPTADITAWIWCEV